MRKIIVLFTALALLTIVGGGMVSAADSPLLGKIIALDAGHGGTSLGAQYPAGCADDGDTLDCLVFEKDVNLSVVYALKDKLEANGALVVLTRKGDETLGLKERSDIATVECKALAGRNCDVFLAVHHNGNYDATHDGTLTIYNGGGNNKRLAIFMHDALVSGLGLKDEGYLSGGYGSTIFGNFTQALTEAYYITNTDEVNAYLAGTKTQQEVDAQIAGLANYFASQTGGKGGKPR